MSFIQCDHVLLQIANSLGELTGLEKAQIYSLLAPPPNRNMGDLAFPCFPLAKTLKKAPPAIAGELKQKAEAKKIPFVSEWKVAGPYLNMRLDTSLIGETVLEDIVNGKYFEQKLTNNPPKSMIEYSQPNTHKEIHVGHMRNLCLGDALVRLHRYCGVNIIASTFPGDVGTHVAKCLWYLKNYEKSQPPKENKGAWLGAIYTKANNLLEEQRETDKEQANRNELTAILKQLHDGKGEHYDKWLETRQWSIDLMQEVYRWANVEFDKWYWESEVDADSVALVNKYYQEGFFIKDQGAIGIDLSDDKLGFCLLIKSDGTGLYATKDIELARRKFEDFQVEKSLYVVDKRQAHHFKQVFKTLEKMGFEQAKDCVHLAYDFVELPDGAMSSRKGNIVPIGDLIIQMQDMITKQYLEKYRGQWPDEQIENTAYQVAAGAIKFGMNRIDPMKKIVFDMAEWLKLDGESGPYVQYVYARINSMILKINKDISKTKVDWSLLQKDQERALMIKLSEFNSHIQTATQTYRTSHLCSYLYDVSKLFNSFYAECPVANSEENIKQARLKLCYATAICLKQGLALLGIESPEQM
jgi:arginyl-tRNA synthetase